MSREGKGSPDDRRNWHLREIGAKAAQDMLPRVTGSDEIDWGPVRIAHIDTGYTRHTTFGFGDAAGTNLLTGLQTNFVDEGETDPLDPLDYDAADNHPGHGTRIGAIMYGRKVGDFEGGVAPGCPVVPYRATNSVLLLDLTNEHRGLIGKAIKHAIDDADCNIISMSLGTPGLPAKNMGRAVDLAYKAGVIVVAASGNNIGDQLTFPGRYARTICAAGIEPDGGIYGVHEETFRKYIDVFAPADGIYRPEMKLVDGTPVEADLGFGDGTSYATACVAGAAALWLAYRDEEIDDLYDKPWQTIEAFRSMLRTTGRPLATSRRGIRARLLDIPRLLEDPLPEPDTLKFVTWKAVKHRV